MYFCTKKVMEIINHDQKIAVMRVLLDIIHADGRIDIRVCDIPIPFVA